MRNFPFYLIFFALNYSFMKLLPLTDIVLVPLALMVFEGVAFTVIYHRVKSTSRAGYLTFLFFVWMLYFGMGAHLVHKPIQVENNLSYLLIFLFPWTLAFIVLGNGWLWRRLKSPDILTMFLNTVMFAMLLVSGYQLVSSLIYTQNHAFFLPPHPELEQSVSGDVDSLPDIYYIILDGYGRQDTLLEYLNFDNSQFIDFLESRGFYVASQSQSNYDHTIHSIASSLNMNYIQPTNQPVHLYQYKATAFSQNQVRSFLTAMGYQFITFYTPFMYTDITDADVYFPLKNLPALHTQRLAELLLPGSLAAIPLDTNLLFPSGRYRDYQEYLLSSLNQLEELSGNSEPDFVFFHVLVPHNPHIFDKNGPITPDSPYLLIREYRGTIEEQADLYRGQVSYISSLMEITVDGIVINSPTPPIIVIQGDHGPGIYLDSGRPAICLRERTSILNAYYLPGLTSNPIYNSITPVNTFRLIFNQYFGTHYQLLEDRIFYNGYSEAFTFSDVTQDSQKTCTVH